MERHTLSDEQWELVEPFFLLSTAKAGWPARNRWAPLSAAFWALATGAA